MQPIETSPSNNPEGVDYLEDEFSLAIMHGSEFDGGETTSDWNLGESANALSDVQRAERELKRIKNELKTVGANTEMVGPKKYKRDMAMVKANIKTRRLDTIDKVLSHLLHRLLSGHLPPTQNLYASVGANVGVGSHFVKLVALGEHKEVPRVITIQNNAFTINPYLDWKDLANFPLTQEICKSFLKI